MFNIQNIDLLQIVLLIPGILLGFTFHEYGHALVAYKLGDETPKIDGRLTLNPFAHIDIIGFIALLFVNFGWGKSVRTNPSAFKKYYRDDFLVSVAGVIGNLIVVICAIVCYGILIKFNYVNGGVFQIIVMIVQITVEVNVLLFILNLVPIPGFDGFHMLRDLFPSFFSEIEETLYRYRVIIMIVFIIRIPGIGSIIDIVVGMPSQIISHKLLYIAQMLSLGF